MIKIFKWYIVSDLDLFIEKDTACRTLSRRIKYLEKENENLYFENDRLRNKQVQVTNIIEPKDITLKNYISEDKIREIFQFYIERDSLFNDDTHKMTVIRLKDVLQELLEENK